MRSTVLLICVLFLVSCEEDYTPKPRAYSRVSLPEPAYVSTEGPNWNCPYRFEFSTQSVITIDPRYKRETCWYNVYYPRYRATIHLTYSTVDENLSEQIEEARKLAMKHIAKATKILENPVQNDSANVYGLKYSFRGETASDVQFFLTDSTSHFLRGSLYFSVTPNKDSLAPIIEYIDRDIDHLIESIRWEEVGN